MPRKDLNEFPVWEDSCDNSFTFMREGKSLILLGEDGAFVFYLTKEDAKDVSDVLSAWAYGD